jgi:lipid-A-disaccharide synthase-like uncharacterized protein
MIATMDAPIAQVFNVVITPWKLIGYLGIALFAGRWVVQVFATRRHGKPVIPRLFWSMSIAGSGLLCAYFIFGKNDSVGLISNLFPMGIAFYNLFIDLASRRSKQGLGGESVDAM